MIHTGPFRNDLQQAHCPSKECGSWQNRGVGNIISGRKDLTKAEQSKVFAFKTRVVKVLSLIETVKDIQGLFPQNQVESWIDMTKSSLNKEFGIDQARPLHIRLKQRPQSIFIGITPPGKVKYGRICDSQGLTQTSSECRTCRLADIQRKSRTAKRLEPRAFSNSVIMDYRLNILRLCWCSI